MSEITMLAELMAAVNVFGGAADMPADVNTDGSFGNILGLLMANAGQVNVPCQEMPDITESQASNQLSLADIISAAAEGDKNAALPPVFTEKGAAAFIRSVSEFFRNDGEELSDEEFEKLWDGVSPEERAAFAELLSEASVLSEDGFADNDTDPANILRAVSALTLRAAKNQDRKSDEKDMAADNMAFIPRTDIMLSPIVTVNVLQNDAADPTSSSDIASGGQAASPIDVSESADNAAPTVTESGLTAELEQAFARLGEAEPMEISEFLKDISQRLNASVMGAADSASEGEKTASADISYISQDNYATESGHIDFGRQNLQGFLARVNKTSLPEAEITAETIITQNTDDGIFSDAMPVPESESEDISSQILGRIELYRDIFSESFSEREIEMKLSPDELGGLEIRIRRSDKGFEITFTAEKAEAAELISGKTSELAEAMASRGIALKEISVARQIVTNEADGSLTGNSFDSESGLYGGAQGENGSDRHFSKNGGYYSDDSTEQQDELSENIFNREAKLWVSA